MRLSTPAKVFAGADIGRSRSCMGSVLGFVCGALYRLAGFLHVLASALHRVATCARHGQRQHREQTSQFLTHESYSRPCGCLCNDRHGFGFRKAALRQCLRARPLLMRSS